MACVALSGPVLPGPVGIAAKVSAGIGHCGLLGGRGPGRLRPAGARGRSRAGPGGAGDHNRVRGDSGRGAASKAGLEVIARRECNIGVSTAKWDKTLYFRWTRGNLSAGWDRS